MEVKAEESLKAKSLAAFCTANDLTDAIRLSLSDYRKQSWMTSISSMRSAALQVAGALEDEVLHVVVIDAEHGGELVEQALLR